MAETHTAICDFCPDQEPMLKVAGDQFKYVYPPGWREITISVRIGGGGGREFSSNPYKQTRWVCGLDCFSAWMETYQLTASGSNWGNITLTESPS